MATHDHIERVTLLSDSDPAPVLSMDGRSDWLLTVEHGGNEVPERLNNLSLPQSELERHIGWDPGALDLALALRERLSAHLVAQRFSRLVIDCNRPRAAPDLVPAISDLTRVPGNTALTESDIDARWDEIHAPFHRAVDRILESGVRNLMSIHTYDPRRRLDGAERPWPVGLLCRTANPLMTRLSHALGGHDLAWPLGVNQPYQIEDASDYTVPVHAEARGLAHVLIEVRNDQLTGPGAIDAFADLLFNACTASEPT